MWRTQLSRLCRAKRPAVSFRGCASVSYEYDDVEKNIAQKIVAVLDPFDRNLNVEALRQFSRSLTPYVVLEVFRHINATKAMQFFWWASNQHGYTHDARTCDEIVQRLCRDRMFKEAKFQMVEMRAAGLNLSLQSLTFLMKSYADSGHVDCAMEIFNYQRSAGILSPESYPCIVNVLARSRRFGEALEVFHEGLDRGSRGNFHALLAQLCFSKMVKEAAGCLKTLLERGIEVFPGSCGLVVTSLCKVQGLDMAMEVFEQAMDAGCYLRSEDFMVFIQGLFRAGKAAEVLRLFNKFAENGPLIDDSTYKYMVDGICKAGMTDDALELVLRMRDTYTPNVAVYNVLINGYCKIFKVTEAYRIFEQMVEDSVTPNVYTYTILLNGLCKSGKTKLALNVFREMKKNECTPQPLTYWALVQHLGQVGEVDEALKILQEQRNLGINTEVVSCTTIVNGMCKVDRHEEAINFVEDMPKTLNVEPNKFTYGTLIYGLHKKGRAIEYMYDLEAKYGSVPAAALPAFVDVLCKQNLLDEAAKCMLDMRNRGIAVDVVTYSTLINALCAGKRFDSAMELLREMSETGVKPDVITYTGLIKLFCKENKLDEAFKVLELMVLAGVKPNIITYNSLMDGLCKNGQMDEVQRLYEVILKSGVTPDVVTYSIIMNGLSKSGKLDNAVKLFELIQANQCGMDAVAYATIIHSLCRAGKLDEACGMYHSMGDLKGSVVHRLLGSLVTELCAAGKMEEARTIVQCAIERGQCGEGADLFGIIDSYPTVDEVSS